jgi:hypothetical protein
LAVQQYCCRPLQSHVHDTLNLQLMMPWFPTPHPPSLILPPTKALLQDHTVKPFSPSPHSSQRSLGKTLSTLWNLSLYN